MKAVFPGKGRRLSVFVGGEMAANLKEMVERYKADRESVYNTWFIGSEARIKAFRYLLFSVNSYRKKC